MLNTYRGLCVACLSVLASLPQPAAAETTDAPIVYWNFDDLVTSHNLIALHDLPSMYAADSASGSKDEVHGFARSVPGVAGNALLLGGINSYFEHGRKQSIFGDRPFSVEAWIALSAYPIHWCPIVAEADEDLGVVFGIDAHGRLGLQAAVDGAWHSVVAQKPIPLRQWVHVAGTFEPNGQLAIYLDGKLVGKQAVQGKLVPAGAAKLIVGKHPVARKPLGTLRPDATGKVHTYFDGLIDELMIYNRALPPEEIAKYVAQSQPASNPPLPDRHLPCLGGEPGRFGASYATLKYYDAWDHESPVGNAADVVVQFDDSNCKFVFWRGTSYIPHWVTENGFWFNNEFVETWSDKGCHEPMSDKECRYSHVRILESNSARVVVQWRYALADNWYSIFRQNEPNNRGEWVEETFSIYPDAIGVRKIVLYSTNPLGAPHEWNEAIVVMGPGQRPEDVLEPAAVTLANPDGESQTYSWQDGPPTLREFHIPPTIEIVNTKSKYKPFLAAPARSQPIFDIYAGEQRPEVSMFPWWNHWPTALDPCDGRYAMAADRASHSSLTHCTWEPYEQTDRSLTKIMLTGMTALPAAELAKIVRSWDSPPKLSVVEGNFTCAGYDPTQRAYCLKAVEDELPTGLTFRIDASKTSPVENLALIVSNWGSRGASVEVNGKNVKARVGHRSGLSETDLVLWVECDSTAPITLNVSPN